MAQQITTGYKRLCAIARERIDHVSAEVAVAEHGDPDTLIVDIRDVRELWRDGRIPGAFHMPRGMLEFWIDPESPYFKEVFGEDKRFIFCCAGGLRSMLATQTAQDMGLKPVASLTGGFAAWRKSGGRVEEVPAKKPKHQAG